MWAHFPQGVRMVVHLKKCLGGTNIKVVLGGRCSGTTLICDRRMHLQEARGGAASAE